MSNSGLSEFMQYVYKYGDVKDVEEAFEEFDPKAEWHEGKIENVDKEKIDEYKESYKQIHQLKSN